MINLKKSWTAIEIASLDKYNLFIRQNRMREKGKIPVHDHITHVVKIDILTGHEEKGNLHFILKINFQCIFFERHAFSENLYS